MARGRSLGGPLVCSVEGEQFVVTVRGGAQPPGQQAVNDGEGHHARDARGDGEHDADASRGLRDTGGVDDERAPAARASTVCTTVRTVRRVASVMGSTSFRR